MKYKFGLSWHMGCGFHSHSGDQIFNIFIFAGWVWQRGKKYRHSTRNALRNRLKVGKGRILMEMNIKNIFALGSQAEALL